MTYPIEINWEKDLIDKRNKIFIESAISWEQQNVELGIKSSDLWRTKYCGDCVHHKPATLKNSHSYTSCDITDESVWFGMKCNKGAWQPIKE